MCYICTYMKAYTGIDEWMTGWMDECTYASLPISFTGDLEVYNAMLIPHSYGPISLT